ncbi:hypothetical protein HHI36_021975 [Cryptolaemus montrouzieri]|uniref:Uncharacterized protein n=1 Tax=Cryptolaemus montrouzieri TaxID=559131 RepID=A0ABD2MZ45_9CUCU
MDPRFAFSSMMAREEFSSETGKVIHQHQGMKALHRQQIILEKKIPFTSGPLITEGKTTETTSATFFTDGITQEMSTLPIFEQRTDKTKKPKRIPTEITNRTSTTPSPEGTYTERSITESLTAETFPRDYSEQTTEGVSKETEHFTSATRIPVSETATRGIEQETLTSSTQLSVSTTSLESTTLIEPETTTLGEQLPM